jgi:hypothetical protein
VSAAVWWFVGLGAMALGLYGGLLVLTTTKDRWRR